MLVQPKLAISQPDDEYEREADRVAETVMRMPEPGAGMSDPGIRVQRACSPCDDELHQQSVRAEKDDYEELIRTKPVGEHTLHASSGIESRIQDLRPGGQPLSESERRFFEPRFNHDFSSVRIHSDASTGVAAKSIQAKAFTLGHDIFFGNGHYMPATSAGKSLIAHELTHVLQQQGRADRISRSKTDDLRKTIVSTALGLSEEHYLMGAAGQIPNKGGGLNSRTVSMIPENHSCSIDVDYGKQTEKKKLWGIHTYVCGGRYDKAKSLPKADPKNEEHHKDPSKYKWERKSDGETVDGEACEGKRHFDCGGFVSYCYHQACPEVKYPGPASGLLSSAFGWTKVDKKNVRAGDVAYREGHAGLCISKDRVISALGKKWGVHQESVSTYTTFGYLGCLKEQEKKTQSIKLDPVEVRGVACACNPAWDKDYDEKTFQFIRSIGPSIRSAARRYGVPMTAIAGAIADEYNTQRGARGILDSIQNAVIGALPESFISVDRFFDIHNKLLNTLENDIGPANIKVRTALELVQRGELTIPGMSPSDIKVNRIVDYLLTERGTVETTAAVIARAQRLFGPYIGEHGEELADAVLVEYFKEGDRYYNRNSQKVKANPAYKICPNEGGCRFWHNRDHIQSELHPGVGK